jgi:hypothetical protein
MPGLRSSGNGKGRTAPKKTAADRRGRFRVGRRCSLSTIFQLYKIIFTLLLFIIMN